MTPRQRKHKERVQQRRKLQATRQAINDVLERMFPGRIIKNGKLLFDAPVVYAPYMPLVQVDSLDSMQPTRLLCQEEIAKQMAGVDLGPHVFGASFDYGCIVRVPDEQ